MSNQDKDQEGKGQVGTSSQGSEGAARLGDGGPAFARPLTVAATGEFSEAQEGLSLRDYFAAKAMAGEFAAEVEGVHEKYFALVAGRAYKMADAMLQARKAGA